MADMDTAFTTQVKHDFDVRRRNVPGAGTVVEPPLHHAVDDDEKKTMSKVCYLFNSSS